MRLKRRRDTCHCPNTANTPGGNPHVFGRVSRLVSRLGLEMDALRAGRYPGLRPVMALSLTNTLTDVLDGIRGVQPSRVSAFHAAATRPSY